MKRVVPGLALAFGWLLLLFLGNSLLFSLVLVLMTAIASYEYVQMTCKAQVGFTRSSLLIPLLVLPILGVVVFQDAIGMQVGLITAFICVSFFVLLNYTKIPDVFLLYSQTVFGAVYVGCLASFLLLLYMLPEGNLWLVILSAVTAGSDTGAYIVGTQFGKHKLCPSVSPNKTIEGALGGLFFGVLFAGIFGTIILPSENLLFILVAAAILTIVSMVGDLTESIIKRGTGCKDSGTILAGHGGVLDRMDSMLFAAPFLYYLLIFVRGL